MPSDPTLGDIVCISYVLDLEKFLPCEGQSLEVKENQALYSLLGNRFGGDGPKTFSLPDLRGKELAPGLKWVIAVSGDYPVVAE